jgi:uncharacterized membrane-anchored protein
MLPFVVLYLLIGFVGTLLATSHSYIQDAVDIITNETVPFMMIAILWPIYFPYIIFYFIKESF